MRIIKYVLRVRILERMEKGGRTKDTQAEADHIKTGGTMRAQFITASEQGVSDRPGNEQGTEIPRLSDRSRKMPRPVFQAEVLRLPDSRR